MYSFERLSALNIKHLITLYKNAFNLDVTLEFLELKYNTKDFGAEYIGYIAFTPERTPAAYYGVFPIVCEYSNREILCAQSGDTMTHQDHRGKGLFVDLAKKTYQLAQELGLKFIFGFPNKNSYPGFVKKLNWQHEGDLNVYSIKIKTMPLAKIAKKYSFFDFFYRPFLKTILSFYNKSPFGFPNSLSADNNAFILHDQSFFNYKKYFKSFFRRINDKAIWFKVDGRLWIADIEKSDEKEFNETIKSLKKLAFFIGATEICFHTSPNTAYDLYMSKIGLLNSTVPVGYLDLDSGLDLSKIKFQPGDFDTF